MKLKVLGQEREFADGMNALDIVSSMASSRSRRWPRG